jgi:hypothetical protein
MTEQYFLDALRIICTRLNEHQVIWAVTGSLGMALQGMDIEVHDIDIQTSQHGAYEIEGYFPEYIVKPVHYLASERMRSHLGVLEIEGVKVEIIGDVQKLLDGQVWEKPVNVKQYRRWINVEGMQVPVISLEYEHQAYLKMGRIEKAEKIKKWLDENRTRPESSEH